jgi:DNA-binding transcriptional LysR family regulator
MDIDSFDLKRLQAFQLVARHGNLRLAAARLNQTIPAVSSRLKRLEHELGVTLFERLPNRLVLTEVGRHFLGEVEAVLQRAERALASLTEASASPGGRLAISTGFDHAWYFAPRIGNFLRHYPNADLDLRIFRAAEALRGLMAGELDVSVGIFPSVPKTLEKEVIVDTTLSAVFLPKDPLLKVPITPAQPAPSSKWGSASGSCIRFASATRIRRICAGSTWGRSSARFRSARCIARVPSIPRCCAPC